VHLDYGEDAGVLIDSAIYTVSVPLDVIHGVRFSVALIKDSFRFYFSKLV